MQQTGCGVGQKASYERKGTAIQQTKALSDVRSRHCSHHHHHHHLDCCVFLHCHNLIIIEKYFVACIESYLHRHPPVEQFCADVVRGALLQQCLHGVVNTHTVEHDAVESRWIERKNWNPYQKWIQILPFDPSGKGFTAMIIGWIATLLRRSSPSYFTP